jgi:hypothetical protein
MIGCPPRRNSMESLHPIASEPRRAGRGLRQALENRGILATVTSWAAVSNGILLLKKQAEKTRIEGRKG